VSVGPESARTRNGPTPTHIGQGDLPAGLAAAYGKAGRIAWDVETTGLDWNHDNLGTCQVYAPGVGASVISMTEEKPAGLIRLLEDPAVQKVFHHAPFDVRFTIRAWDAIPASIRCTKVASKLLKPQAPPGLSRGPGLTVRLQCGIMGVSARTSQPGGAPMSTASIDLDTIRLTPGLHGDRQEGLCLMEAVAWFAGESHTDRPACVSPLLAAAGRTLNDDLPGARRQELVPLIPRLAWTARDGLDERRGYMALDWVVRVWAPAWLDGAGLTVQAAALRSLRPVAGRAAAVAAARVALEVQQAASAARAAARAAAGDTARDAARDAVRDAVRDAGGNAVRAAAQVAAWDAVRAGVDWDSAEAAAAQAAARDAAWAAAEAAAEAAAARDAAEAAAARDAAEAAAEAAARDALAPTASQLQDSAISLYRRMITGEEM
jgi:hypothetical protein